MRINCFTTIMFANPLSVARSLARLMAAIELILSHLRMASAMLCTTLLAASRLHEMAADPMAIRSRFHEGTQAGQVQRERIPGFS